MSSASKRLPFLLGLQQELGGSIPFHRWMETALYHPQHGYYTANIRTVGRSGDFSTWATLHQSLGQSIARWLKDNGAKQIIEIGAGTGELAGEILRNFSWWKRPRYHIVEASPVLREQQQKLLRRKPVRWHTSMAEALNATKGCAAIFSNELVDAFPCRIFQKQGDAWRELALQISENRILETWLDNPLPDSSIFEQSWPDNQRVEVHESFHKWLADWLPTWKQGKMLTIDYGDLVPGLYHRQPRGSLRAYAHHQRLEGTEAYAGFGLRDMTADVNFSDLIRWGEVFGLRTELSCTLGEFMEEKSPALFAPGGAAEAFRVLVQAR